MNYANPIVICDENEEFRILIRDMLTKNGFFHIIEVINTEEMHKFTQENQEAFLLIESHTLKSEDLRTLQSKKNYIVFVQNDDEKTVTLSAQLGVEHFMSYPFHSEKLIQKMQRLS